MESQKETTTVQEVNPNTNTMDVPQKQNLFMSFAPLLLVFGIFYVLIIRPQQKKQKEQIKMLNSMQIGDKVVLGAGIIGIISNIDLKLNLVNIIIDENGSMLTVYKSSINEILKDKTVVDKVETKKIEKKIDVKNVKKDVDKKKKKK